MVFSISLICMVCGLSCSEKSDHADSGNMRLKNAPRVHSPLAEETSISIIDGLREEDIWALFDQLDEEQIIPLPMKPTDSHTTILRHKIHDYEISLKWGSIAQNQATAVITTYNTDKKLPKVSLALFQQAGEQFVSWLRSFYRKEKDLFHELKKMPGNTYVLHPELSRPGNLSVDMMAFIHVPRVVSQKKRGAVIQGICNGLMHIVCYQVYLLLKQYDIRSGSIVLPAIGSDELFRGYPGPVMAKMVLHTVLRGFRFLHGLGNQRLKRVSFVIDSSEAYNDYAQAFQELYEKERDYFDLIEEPFRACD